MQVDGTPKKADSIISAHSAKQRPHNNNEQLIFGCLVRPTSFGDVAISSAAPFAKPKVSPIHSSDPKAPADAPKRLQTRMKITDHCPAHFQLYLVYRPPLVNVSTQWGTPATMATHLWAPMT